MPESTYQKAATRSHDSQPPCCSGRSRAESLPLPDLTALRKLVDNEVALARQGQLLFAASATIYRAAIEAFYGPDVWDIRNHQEA